MLPTIRDEQLRALQVAVDDNFYEQLVPRVVRRLRDLGFAPKEPLPPAPAPAAAAPKPPPGQADGDETEPDDEPGPPREEEPPVERMTAGQFEAEVAACVKDARAQALRGEDYVVQYASYRFVLGPRWTRLASVREVLDSPAQPERERIEALSLALSKEV